VPIVERAGARLHYAVHGSGPAVLALAPSGMRSAGELWERAPWNPVEELAATHRVIVMDQRNASASTTRRASELVAGTVPGPGWWSAGRRPTTCRPPARRWPSS